MTTPTQNHQIQSSQEALYEVFGRLTPNDVMTHIGSIRAPNSDLAIVRARSICGTRFQEICLAQTQYFLRASSGGDSVLVKEF